MNTLFAKADKQANFIRKLRERFPNGFNFAEAERSAENVSHRVVVRALKKAVGPILEQVKRGVYRWR